MAGGNSGTAPGHRDSPCRAAAAGSRRICGARRVSRSSRAAWPRVRPRGVGAQLAVRPFMYRTLPLCLVAACGASTAAEQPGPRGLRADQHLAMADREEDRANEITHWPDARPDATGRPGDQRLIGTWFGTWDTSSEHRRLALVHRSLAAQLEAEYEEACGETPFAVASVSPLQRYGIGGSEVPDGVLVLLSKDAGPPDRLLSEMRCHRAWMMLGRTDMDDCPLDLGGIHVSARGDDTGIALTITVANPSQVAELRRRTAHDLAAAQRRRQPAPPAN